MRKGRDIAMRKSLRFCGILICMLFFGMFMIPETVKAEIASTVTVEVKYGQTEAREMLQWINEFRTGADAWIWNETDSEKVYQSGLGSLVYDYRLEKIAMQRAVEVALLFAHERPDGTGGLDTAFGSYGTYKGENLGAGYATAKNAFEGLKETNKPYSGQEHRRNMLYREYNAVGIGHVYYNGFHYWVQEFAFVPSPDISALPAEESTRQVEVQVLPSKISNLALESSESKISMRVGESIQLPSVTLSAKIEGHWPGNQSCPVSGIGGSSLSWSSSDESIALVKDGRVTAVTAGNTELRAITAGASTSCIIEVMPLADPDIPDERPDRTDKPVSKECIITFDANGGTVSFISQETVSQRLLTLPLAFRDGYTFMGWYTQASGGTQVTINTVFESDVTVFAQWKQDTVQQPPAVQDYIGYKVTALAETSATVQIEIPKRYVKNWGWLIGQSAGKLGLISEKACYSDVSLFTINYVGLQPGTTYYYAMYYVSDTEKIYSEEKSFTTKQVQSQTEENGQNYSSFKITELSETKAVMHVTTPSHYVKSWGYSYGTSRYSLKECFGSYCYRNIDNYKISMDNLSPDTTYYFQMYYISDAEKIYSDITSFTTKATSTPTDTETGKPGAPVRNDPWEWEDTEQKTEVHVKKIKLKTVSSPSKGKMKISWDWYLLGDGYQVAYSKSRSFPPGKTSYKNVNFINSQKTISRLSKGKTYYVKIRAYRKVDGQKYYGKWSNTKKVKIKKK